MFVSVGEEWWHLESIARLAPGVRGTWNVWFVWGERVSLPPVKGTCLKQMVEEYSHTQFRREVNSHRFSGRDWYHSTIEGDGDSYDEVMNRYL